jgi:hypothetical protein
MVLRPISAPVPPFRPGICSAAARKPAQIRRLRRDRSHWQQAKSLGTPDHRKPGEVPIVAFMHTITIIINER